MVASAVFNEAIVFATVLSLIRVVKRMEKGTVHKAFRFFTTLSNVFCGLAALLMLLCELGGSVPMGVLLLKYIATCAVTVTFFTVLLFLWPSTRSSKGLWDGPELVMHLITPLLALVSVLCFEKGELPFGVVFLGALPVIIYGVVYLNRVVFTTAWEDFYGFNKNGKWHISMAAMFVAAFLISVLLWWL